jgi:hypothetical protein
VLKWLLVGWVCTGVGQEQACLRMASEVIHEDLKSCKEYYKVIYNELNVPNVTVSFDCVQAAVLEDVL